MTDLFLSVSVLWKLKYVIMIKSLCSEVSFNKMCNLVDVIWFMVEMKAITL